MQKFSILLNDQPKLEINKVNENTQIHNKGKFEVILEIKILQLVFKEINAKYY